MIRAYNFSAGPAMLPTVVLEQVKEELLDWQHLGASVMEISHRSKPFVDLALQSEQDLRELLAIPDNYHILFMQGGGRAQFSMVPMNLLGHHQIADYFNTGAWSDFAIFEAQRYCQVNIVADSKEQGYTFIPPREQWQWNPQAAYCHYTDNETIHGVEFSEPPFRDDDVPLVSDMSSNFLSRPIDIQRFGVIYATSQKNFAPAGLTIVIIRDDLLGSVLAKTPTLYTYQTYAQHHSLYNTPPTFSWYVAGLVFKWLKKQGGIAAITATNTIKAKLLYQCIDDSDFYSNPVQPENRSRMNVIFNLANDQLTNDFIQQASSVGLIGLKGHQLVGGIRASIYNSMPLAGVEALIRFMNDFEQHYG